MIANERQYRIVRGKARTFVSALEEFDATAAERTDTHPRLLQAEREAIESQLADLQDELDEYEQLKSAPLPDISMTSFDQLAEGLIKARIASGLSQRALAERLDMRAQQIQRYEAERYASASYQRLCEVAHALRIRSEMTFSLR